MEKNDKPKGQPLDPEKLYTVEQLAESLGLSEVTIRKKARKGIIPCFRQFGRFYFLGKDVIKAITEYGERLDAQQK